MADGLPLREYFRQVLGAQDVSKGGGGKEARGVAVLKNILIHFSIDWSNSSIFCFCENNDFFSLFQNTIVFNFS